MFNVNGTVITLSRGDTGALRIRVRARRKDTGEAFTFGERDRALFTIKNASGAIVKQVAYPMTDNVFKVTFFNADTDKFAPGTMSWDVRYVINPYYDSANNIVDGDQVLTPTQPLSMQLLTVVGDI